MASTFLSYTSVLENVKAVAGAEEPELDQSDVLADEQGDDFDQLDDQVVEGEEYENEEEEDPVVQNDSTLDDQDDNTLDDQAHQDDNYNYDTAAYSSWDASDPSKAISDGAEGVQMPMSDAQNLVPSGFKDVTQTTSDYLEGLKQAGMDVANTPPVEPRQWQQPTEGAPTPQQQTQPTESVPAPQQQSQPTAPQQQPQPTQQQQRQPTESVPPPQQQPQPQPRPQRPQQPQKMSGAPQAQPVQQPQPRPRPRPQPQPQPQLQPQKNVTPPPQARPKQQPQPQPQPEAQKNVTPPPQARPKQQPQPQPQAQKNVAPPPQARLEQQPQPQPQPQPQRNVTTPPQAKPKQQPQQKVQQPQPELETQPKSIPSVLQQVKVASPSGVVLPTPEEDATTLFTAFKGKGCDVARLVNILAQRDATHRHLIEQHYSKNYGEELSNRLSAELSILGRGDLKERVGLDTTLSATGSLSRTFSSNIKKAISLWMLEESERDATIVWQALQVVSFDKAAVTEVICSRTPSQLRNLKRTYFSKYSSQLLQEITSSNLRFNGNHKELMIACLDDMARDEGTNVDMKLAEDDAKQLYKDGENIWGTNNRTFIDIFTRRNRPHLAAVDDAYHKLYGHSLEEAVQKETSRSFQTGLMTLLKCAKNPAKFFAEVLHNSMKGPGTANTTLIRIVVTRADIDMEDIKKEYGKEYKTSLKDAIHDDTSGDYRTFLLNLVEKPKGALAVD